MAAAYLAHRAPAAGLEDLVVESAGTLGIRGAPASGEAVQAMAELGVDLRAHRSRPLGAENLESALMTVAMAHEHLEYLALHHPEGHDRRLLLRAFERGARPDPDPRDVVDPIGRSVEFYREQAKLIARCVENLIRHLSLRR